MVVKRRHVRRRGERRHLGELEWIALETGLAYLGALGADRRARRVDDDLAREAWASVDPAAREAWDAEHPGYAPWAARYDRRGGKRPGDEPGMLKIRGRKTCRKPS